MKLIFGEQAWDDYCFWQQHDTKLLRRINLEHRLAYRVSNDGLMIAQCRYHY